VGETRKDGGTELTPSHEDAGGKAPEPEGTAVVCWTYPDGRIGRGSALTAATAVELMRLYEQRYPDRKYWIEDLPG
jgi:hypothetical protein